MSFPKIPDDIYENRCRHCRHFVSGKENREIKDFEIWLPKFRSPCPCEIQSIAGYKYQIHDKNSYTTEVYEDGECRTFSPNYGYPMCYYCEYFNHFMAEVNYCTNNVPIGKRRVVALGNTYGNEANLMGYYICDKWKLRHSSKDIAIKYAAEGKLPKIFDPETLKLIKPAQTNAVAENWLELESKRQKEIEKENREKELKKVTDKDGQMRLF